MIVINGPSNLKQLHTSISIDSIQNGLIYEGQVKNIEASSEFSGIVTFENVIIKIPSARVLQAYENLFEEGSVHEQQSIKSARQPEGLELGTHFREVLDKYPEFEASINQCLELGLPIDAKMARTYAYYLILHKMNYENITDAHVLHVPKSKFVLAMLRKKRFFGVLSESWDFGPIVVQKRVNESIRLWDMYNPRTEKIRDKYRQYADDISAQLGPVLDSNIVVYLDYSPENFLFNPSTRKLYYVDIEPTFFVDSNANNHNLSGLRRFFYRLSEK